jgi:hypothetical protein
MSYSYVTSVFPDFKYSNVYNEDIYKNINISNEFKVSEEIKPEFEKPSFLLETFNNNQEIPPNLPVHVNQNEHEPELDRKHNEYIKHVLDCEECKVFLKKELNIESNNIFNEEILELLSFIIFGVLILLLIDNLKN